MKKLIGCLLALLVAVALFFAGTYIYENVISLMGSGQQETEALDLGAPGQEVQEQQSMDPGSSSEPAREFEIGSETEPGEDKSQTTVPGDSATDGETAIETETSGPSSDGYIDILEDPYEDTGLTLTVLDVGQALSILIECNGQYMLYDGGERDTSSYVVSYLQGQGITELTYVVASHYDSDHISGLVGVLNVFDVKHVIGTDHEAETEIYGSFMDAVARLGLQVEHPSVGDRLKLGGAVITVLGPEYITDAPNDNSIVLKISYGDCSFLLPGDAEAAEEEWLVSSGADLSADVLVVGHHGSRTSTSRAFINAVSPEHAIISCGKGNPYGNPEAGVLVLIKKVGADLFRTDRQGDIIAHTDGREITWNVEPCNDFAHGDLDTIPWS